jgi:XTP/dITP diphosphohydrolase
LEFMNAVRSAEKGIAAERRGDEVPEELDIAALDSVTEEEWRAYWPSPVAAEPAEDESAPEQVPEPTPADVPEPEPAHVPEPAPVEVPEPAPVEVPESTPEQRDGETGDQPPAMDEEFRAEKIPVIEDGEAAVNGVAQEDQPKSVEPQ